MHWLDCRLVLLTALFCCLHFVSNANGDAALAAAVSEPAEDKVSPTEAAVEEKTASEVTNVDGEESSSNNGPENVEKKEDRGMLATVARVWNSAASQTAQLFAPLTMAAVKPHMDVVRPLNIILLGPPGVGKGTYSSRLSSVFDIPHISTGDMIRAEIKKDEDLGKRLKQFTKAGALVPDQLVIAIAKNRLEEEDAKQGYLLDGFPRTVEQAKELVKFSKPTLVLNLNLPFEILKAKLVGRRVCQNCNENYNIATIKEKDYDMPPILPEKEGECNKCGEQLHQRADDKPEIVANRLEVYLKETAPLIDFFSKDIVTFEPKKGLAEFDKIVDLIRKHANSKPTEATASASTSTSVAADSVKLSPVGSVPATDTSSETSFLAAAA